MDIKCMFGLLPVLHDTAGCFPQKYHNLGCIFAIRKSTLLPR
jgi:hypothetical protein